MSTLSRTIMLRVHSVYFLRYLFLHLALAAAILALALFGIAREVWVARVVQNMPPFMHVRTFALFFLGAFAHTEILVQICVLAVLASGAVLAAEAVKLIGRISPFA